MQAPEPLMVQAACIKHFGCIFSKQHGPFILKLIWLPKQKQ